MTFIVRVTDPTVPDGARAVKEGAGLKEILDSLHDNPRSFVFDLDTAEDEEAFEKAYGEELRIRAVHLEEGETFTVTCVKRVDDWEDADPGDEKPVLATPIRGCPFCPGKPQIVHEYGRGFLIRCPECGTVAGKETWSTRLADAIARWNGVRA